jgi:hypothetical protein
MHVEWSAASAQEVRLMTASEADDELSPDEPIDGTHVLFLGGAGGGGLAVEGNREEILAWATRLCDVVLSQLSGE